MTRCSTCQAAGRARCSCSRKTSPKVRALLLANAVKGGIASGSVRRAQSEATWRTEAAGLSAGDFGHKCYRRGYRNGFITGDRHGFKRGHAAAMKEMAIRRSA